MRLRSIHGIEFDGSSDFWIALEARPMFDCDADLLLDILIRSTLRLLRNVFQRVGMNIVQSVSHPLRVFGLTVYFQRIADIRLAEAPSSSGNLMYAP